LNECHPPGKFPPDHQASPPTHLHDSKTSEISNIRDSLSFSKQQLYTHDAAWTLELKAKPMWVMLVSMLLAVLALMVALQWDSQRQKKVSGTPSGIWPGEVQLHPAA
jgi:hypothetical protein